MLHLREHSGVFCLLRQVVIDVLHRYQRMHRNTKVPADLHHRSGVLILANLTAIDRNKHVFYRDICCLLQQRHRLADSGTSGDDIFDDEDAVVIFGLVPY